MSVACAWVTEEGRSEASKLEARLKKLTKEKKELLVQKPELVYDLVRDIEGMVINPQIR